VRGNQGNQGILLSDDATKSLRSSILIHSFSATAAGWTGGTMHNSAGCLHAHPDDLADVTAKIAALGVTERTNPNQPYNYDNTGSTQGMVSIYLATSETMTPVHLMSSNVNEESDMGKFFKTGAGITVAAVAFIFLVGVIGAGAMSKMGYRPEIFRLSAERFSLIVGDRFSTTRESTTTANVVDGAETEMSTNPVVAGAPSVL